MLCLLIINIIKGYAQAEKMKREINEETRLKMLADVTLNK